MLSERLTTDRAEGGDGVNNAWGETNEGLIRSVLKKYMTVRD